MPKADTPRNVTALPPDAAQGLRWRARIA